MGASLGRLNKSIGIIIKRTQGLLYLSYTNKYYIKTAVFAGAPFETQSKISNLQKIFIQQMLPGFALGEESMMQSSPVINGPMYYSQTFRKCISQDWFSIVQGSRLVYYSSSA